MLELNTDKPHLRRSSNADGHRQKMSRATHQTSNRPMHLSNLKELSHSIGKKNALRSSSKTQVRMKTEIDYFWEFVDEILLRGKIQHPKQSVSKQNSRLQSRTTSDETFKHPGRTHPLSQHRAGDSAAQELYKAKPKRDVQEENLPHHGLWGEIKHLLKYTFSGHAECESSVVLQKQREERAAARARTERAALPSSFNEHKNSYIHEGSSHADIARPQPAITRSENEAIQQKLATIRRKPVPERTEREREREVPGYTPDTKQAVLVEQDPLRFKSMRAVRQMASKASTASSKRTESTYGSQYARSRVTQLGDFMIAGIKEDMHPLPPKEPKEQIRPSSPKATPCSVCGTFPHKTSHFSWTPTNLWLCPACIDPILSPIESPPPPSKLQKHQRYHISPNPKGSSIPDSTILKARSPLSVVIQRGRNMSDASNREPFPNNDDGSISPLSEWEQDMVDVSASMPPSRPDTPISEEEGKKPSAYQLPPIRPLSPLQPKPRATSSVYPDDERPSATVPEVPVPAIPARFLQERTKQRRRVISNCCPADGEGDPRLDMPLPPIPLRRREQRPASLRMQGKSCGKNTVDEEVMEEKRGRLGAERVDNRRSSFYRPEKEIFAEY